MNSWVKGGLIGFVIGVLLLVIGSFFIPVRCIGLSQDGTGCSAPEGFDAFVINLTTLIDNLGMAILYFIIPGGIIGGLIGFVIRKIKSKGVK